MYLFAYVYICYRKTANRHFLKSMARVGAGYDEFFDPKTKSKWQRKVLFIKYSYVCIPTQCMSTYMYTRIPQQNRKL